MCDEITYLFPNLNGCTIEVCEHKVISSYRNGRKQRDKSSHSRSVDDETIKTSVRAIAIPRSFWINIF